MVERFHSDIERWHWDGLRSCRGRALACHSRVPLVPDTCFRGCRFRTSSSAINMLRESRSIEKTRDGSVQEARLTHQDNPRAYDNTSTMAPSAVPIAPTTLNLDAKVCKKPHVSALQVERTLAAVEDHVADLVKDAATTLDPSYTIAEKPIGTRRPIRVACMGAGYSGLMMAILFSQKMMDKNAELVIYERNEDLGGTWLENRYESMVLIFQKTC